MTPTEFLKMSWTTRSDCGVRAVFFVDSLKNLFRHRQPVFAETGARDTEGTWIVSGGEHKRHGHQRTGGYGCRHARKERQRET